MEIKCYDSDSNLIKFLTQWDLNQKIIIQDLTTSDSPAVHACNSRSTEAYVCKSTYSGSTLTFEVPNILLQEELPLIFFIYLSKTNGSAKTVYTIRIPVNPRPKPNEYTFSNNAYYITVQELLKALTDAELAISKANTAAANAESIAESYDNVPTDVQIKDGGIYLSKDNTIIGNGVQFDNQLNVDSLTPVQNQVITKEFNNIYSSFANAIKNKISGNIVRVDDVSPVNHIMNVTVDNKNIWDGESFFEKGSNSHTLTVNITEPIVLSFKTTEDIEYSNQVWIFGVYYADGTSGGYVKSSYAPSGGTYSKVFTASKDNPITKIIGRGEYISAGRYYDIQIELGETPTDYSPHIDPTTIKLTGCGKNLVTYPYASKTGTFFGVTYTEDGNGKITVKGTTPETSGVSWNIAENVFLKKGTYTLSGAEKLNGIDMRVYSPSKKKSYAWLKAGKKYVTFAVDEDVTDALVYLNSSARNVTVSGYCLPQLEIGETATAYELYNGVTYTPNADGSCEVVSVSPTMTLFTDLSTATITCEYNRDINKVIETLTQAIISLGGNV